MSLNRWLNYANERYNRTLVLAELNPVQLGYERDVQAEYGRYLDPEQKIDFLTMVSINSNLRLLTEDIRKNKGQVYGQTFTLTIGEPIFIDFVDPANNRGTPRSTVITPRQPVFGLDLTNQGAGNLLYSINTIGDNGSALLLANAPTKEFRSQRQRYEFINLQAIGANCTVNIAIEV